MSTSVRYVGPSPHVDLPTLDIYGQKRLVVFEVEDREVAEGLLARDDFERPPAKKAAARKKAAPKTDPAPAGDDAPATSADADQSEED